VSPLRGEKPENRSLSKLDTGRLALRAMLPVKIMAVNQYPYYQMQSETHRNRDTTQVENQAPGGAMTHNC